MISFSKYHGCGNSFIIVREKELVRGMQRQEQGAKGLKDGKMQSADVRAKRTASFAKGDITSDEAADAEGPQTLTGLRPAETADAEEPQTLTGLRPAEERLSLDEEKALLNACGRFAKKACDTSIGIGADGLIIVRETPALEMLFFNCDGSRAPMCGNGIRCFAHYCYEENICGESTYAIRTLAGDMIVDVTRTEPFRVKINMGRPIFSPAVIGVDYRGENFLRQELTLADGSRREISSLFMGTVHTVVFTDNLDDEDSEALGKEICEHPAFNEKTNVNFIEITDGKTLRIKTYERGVGMTQACGTGACASVVVAGLQGRCLPETEVVLPLGSLMITLDHSGDVYMEGPSTKVCDGTMLADV